MSLTKLNDGFGKKFLSNICYIFILALLSYLIFNTGLHGDDYTSINAIQKGSFKDFLSFDSDKFQLFGIVNYYSIWFAYYVFGLENQIFYDAIKLFVHGFSIYFIFQFFKDYLPRDRALLSSVIFVLFPLHDTTTYWYMTLYYIFIPGTLLYSHYLIRNNRYLAGVVMSTLGAMAHYASPPYVFGLAVIFLIENKFKKAVIFAIPGFLYVAYYFWIKFNLIGIERRINLDLSILDFFKQAILQVLSFLESAIGPSYWLKVFYAIESISITSLIIVIVISVFAFLKYKNISKAPPLSKSLLVGFISVLILSFGMYALTGLYSHSALNLGNRSTVYGSLLIAFLLSVFLPSNKKSVAFLLIIFLTPTFGLSDHWKYWNSHQKTIIENIKNNKDLKDIEYSSTLVVTGNIYSKLGPFAHIEFFSMPWNVNAIFQDSVKAKNIVALTPYVVVEADYIIDPKFNGKYSLKNKLYIYDSEKDLVKSISAKEVPNLIEQQPRIVRHWMQIFKDTWIQNTIVWLSPRLIYLFE